MTFMLRLVAVLGVLAAWCASATAATYVVDQAKGNDAAAGSEAAPWQTVNKGVEALKAGDTLLIKAGVYRELVTVKALGTAAAPIVIKAAPGERVVLSGADRVTTWTPCTKEQAGGNENFGKMVMADIAWSPLALFEDGKEQMLARSPNEGWWPTVKADAMTITDPAHLKKGDNWAGATMFFFRYKGVQQTQQTVNSFDPETGTLTLAAPLWAGTKTQYTPGSDRYRLQNKVTLIDRPGEWCYESKGEQETRVYYWPHTAKVADALIELPRRGQVLNLGSTAYCTVEGLEIVHAIRPGRTADAAIGNDINKQVSGACQSITIKGCTIHHNGRFGFAGRGYKDLKFLGNLVYRNEYGVSLGGQNGTLIEGNEIAENLVDGLIIGGGSHDITVRRNYIHHHSLFGHPDNIQLHSDVKNITFEDNFVLGSGQTAMMEACDNITFRNNTFAGSAANMMIMGHGNATHGRWERNTFALWTMSLFSLTAQDYELKDNIMVNNGGAIFYSIPAKGTFTSDHNLWYIAPGIGTRLGGMAGADKSQSAKFNSLDDIRTKSGQETTSEMKDPQFKNAPMYCVVLDSKRIGDCTCDKLIVPEGDAARFAKGDVVEVHFDGVVRKVTTIDGGTLTIDPPLSEIPDRPLFISNWKDKTNFVLDFTSPFNDQFGSKINTAAYQRGDFDGDGKPDRPLYR
jgi:hypothetical protein